ncbi:3-isopropylmalate dehydratase small subunit [Leptospira fluminis]|uniref:3-isopropylmalate dehydratase small subunit n=1 Tax=Leptospira fluminis TaxID=2484979 RepID=A0A4R9GQ30_9LEPT|nr:3-isopropylmalate dehydratase small subunit [Leptospira fluminis]TGK19285.1 3-isopropylmalate dehydratase small subunit [Leptospira fluminis]
MSGWTKHKGIVAPLLRADIDTDQILPKQFMKKIERTGFGKHLFHDWRYSDEEGRIPNPNFILNRSGYASASILLTGSNFGCGSSREHAPWALADFGIRAIIAPSFADIFSINCPKNGIALLKIGEPEMEILRKEIDLDSALEVEIDLSDRTIGTNRSKFGFDLGEDSIKRIRNGWDDVDLTLDKSETIEEFENRYFKDRSFQIPNAVR